MNTFLLVNFVLIWAFIFLLLALILRTNIRLENMLKRHEPPPSLPINSNAPEFRARTIDNTEVSLEDVVKQDTLFIFVHPYCQPCIEAVTLVNNARFQLNDINVQVLIVAETSESEANSFVIEHDIATKVIIPLENANDFVSQYNPSGFFPSYCLISKEHLVLASGLVGDQKWYELWELWNKHKTIHQY